jgi:hypothetical protein
MYANWRIAKVGRAGLFWFGQRTGGLALEPELDNLDKTRFAGS